MMSESKLSAGQRQELNRVLDEIIPPSADGRMPGAGKIDLAAAVEAVLAKNPGMHAVIDQGLGILAELTAGRGCDDLGAVPKAERAALMKDLESKDAGFVMTLMFVAYGAYYQDAAVLEGLGIEPRPPHPKGYQMKPHDLSLLDAVRRRGRMFR
jgi:hypothetical protein